MYTYVAVFSFLHPGRCTYVYVLRARLYYDTCAPLHPPVYMYVHVRDQNDKATYASTRWVPTISHFLACEDIAGGSQQPRGRIVLFFLAQTHFLACEDVAGGSAVRGANRFFCLDALPCVRRCSWWVPAVRGANRFFCPDALPCVRRCSWWVPAVRRKHFFCEIRWPVRWVPAVRWRNHYFPCNKEALPCCGRGPSCQPLHVQSMSDGSRSLTTLTMPRREHQGGGRR